MIADDPGYDAVFTSANFDIRQSAANGPTFSTVSGRNEVASRLVQLIDQAQSSIRLASGHLRSRAVAEALLAKHEAHPELDIQVYLDGQEYIGEWYHQSQQKEQAACLEAAGDSVSKQQARLDKGFYYSYVLHAAGIPLRFKYSCYRWDYHYAVQMHHKYAVFDGRVVASGSYNLSDNAEHNTMENLVVYQPAAGLADAFEDNFRSVWDTGVAQKRYESLVDLIENTSKPIPIVFEPMALTWQQVTDLKDLIRKHCPAVDSQPYRDQPDKHRVCYR
jgi:phosphatidylserine/phosphatidylglycerophosphate/cardiolipin synthase-like enzyme